MNDEKKYMFQWCLLSTVSVPLIRFSIFRYKDSTEEEIKITLDENKKVVSDIILLQKEGQQININDIDDVGKRNIDVLLKCLELEQTLKQQKPFIQQELHDSLYHSLYEKKKHLSILLYRSLKKQCIDDYDQQLDNAHLELEEVSKKIEVQNVNYHENVNDIAELDKTKDENSCITCLKSYCPFIKRTSNNERVEDIKPEGISSYGYQS